jgi:hypothetical protein
MTNLRVNGVPHRQVPGSQYFLYRLVNIVDIHAIEKAVAGCGCDPQVGAGAIRHAGAAPTPRFTR